MDQNIKDCFKKSLDETAIPGELYKKYSVKKGLRNEDGTGVLVGLTNISDVVGYKKVDGEKVDDYGTLYYRGINVKDIVENGKGRRFLYEEVCFLILFGYLPNREELEHFKKTISDHYTLPERYLELNILGYPEKNLMNKLQREVLMLYSYDDDPDNVGVLETLYKGIDLIAKIPVIVSYTYQSKVHHFDKGSMIIHHQNYDYSIAEQILYLLRRDGTFSNKEAEVLNTALILHADHGGGNNSTFTTHVVSSSGTDTYSAIAASIGSLKGPRHGGANLKAQGMFDDIKKSVKDWTNEDEIREYLRLILDKKAFDKTGLIYGMGHAVYTISDPREKILKSYAQKLASEKGFDDEFALYDRVERIAGEEIMTHRKMLKPVCANVDFYSGFVYTMLNIPEELFTPLFAIARITGWSAHRLEELLNAGKIIRPAYKYVGQHTEFHERDDRN